MNCRPILIIFLLISLPAWSQFAGGSAAYQVLAFPAGAQNTALGGENISNINPDLSMVFQNPALLRKNLDRQLAMVFGPLPAGIRQYLLTGAVYSEKLQTSFGASVHYFDFGNMDRNDASGNSSGTFRPRDYVVQFMAGRQYRNRWHYGMALKMVRSEYDIYRSGALAMDIGVNYYDSSRGIQAGLVMKNMGVQLRTYSGNGQENLPFDLQVGVTKKLAKAPMQFSLTARELHRLILYKADSSGLADHLLQHLVFGMQFLIAERVELSAGYNHLRRKELVVPNAANGLTGFSLGAGVILPGLQLRYARGFYSNSRGINQFGLNLRLYR